MYEVAHARSQRLHIPIVTWLYWIGVHIPALVLYALVLPYFYQDHPDGGELFVFGLLIVIMLSAIGSMSYGQAWILKRTIDPNSFKHWFRATIAAYCAVSIAKYMLSIDHLLFSMFRTSNTSNPFVHWIEPQLISVAITCLVISSVQAWILRKAGYRMLHWIPTMLLSWVVVSLTIASFNSLYAEAFSGSTVLVMGCASLLNGLGLFLIQSRNPNSL
ncbi:MAG TPA: hypothetical protein DEF47_22025 [Herpetosiphon sp.]|uniref:Uncharacterized protein n=1 Tax=Herpetosiphon aurantiacus (strain ATCC 23779 / DSM 785 / 114-95) TaxID=316274 RepID=A9AW35_HERA2|nr:hypothetical protein [Herpetosiphon sp.]ABX03273.1 hypothetical protein Haur_0625 [Herpetosiphon aurantiacus DSM 785]HBW52569.1 hypothetical protein [Herpetosiphon sp.]